MSASLVVFDLDGTLIDTAHDLVASLNHTIGLEGLDPVGYGDLTYLVGHGGQVMIKRAFSLRGRDITDGELERMLGVFVQHYAEAMPGVSVPYPGLVEAMDRLADAGYRLAVCTNKMEGLARRLIDDPQRQQAYGRAGRELATARFGLQAVVERTMACYRQLLAAA